MEVRDLQVFISVAKHLNYTRAGEEVHLSQPSVSVRIRQLESELGLKLFEQLGKKVALTEAGQLLVRARVRIGDARDCGRSSRRPCVHRDRNGSEVFLIVATLLSVRQQF